MTKSQAASVWAIGVPVLSYSSVFSFRICDTRLTPRVTSPDAIELICRLWIKLFFSSISESNKLLWKLLNPECWWWLG